MDDRRPTVWTIPAPLRPLRTADRSMLAAQLMSPMDGSASVGRGGWVHNVSTGQRARFVGISPMGVLWLAYPGQDYEAMAARFDARWPDA